MSKTYVILGSYAALAFASDAAVKAADLGGLKAIFGDEHGLAESGLSGGELVKVYNGLAAKPYDGDRFTNRLSGVKRTFKLIEALPVQAEAAPAQAPAQPECEAPEPEPVVAGGTTALATDAIEPEPQEAAVPTEVAAKVLDQAAATHAPEKALDTASASSETTGTDPVPATSGQAIQVRWPAKARGFDAGAWLDDLIASGLKPDAIDVLISLGRNNEINPEVIKRVKDELAKRTKKAAKAAKKATKAATPKGERKPRENSKKETVFKLLRRANGASAAELQEATGWQAHSLRGFLSTARSNGNNITSEKSEKRGTVYKLAE